MRLREISLLLDIVLTVFGTGASVSAAAATFLRYFVAGFLVTFFFLTAIILLLGLLALSFRYSS